MNICKCALDTSDFHLIVPGQPIRFQLFLWHIKTTNMLHSSREVRGDRIQKPGGDWSDKSSGHHRGRDQNRGANQRHGYLLYRVRSSFEWIDIHAVIQDHKYLPLLCPWLFGVGWIIDNWPAPKNLFTRHGNQWLVMGQRWAEVCPFFV